MPETGGTEITCLVCQKPFRTSIQGRYGKLCPECRAGFGIRNSVEAEKLLTILEEDSGNDLNELKRQRKSGGFDQMGFRGRVVSKMDPVKLAEAVRTTVNYTVTVPLPPSLPKPTNYVIAKNGLFEVRETDIARIIIQPKDVLGLSETLTPGVTLNIPKAPYVMLQQTVAFFREVCIKMNETSEALVQIWWNRAQQTHVIHVPEQTVSGGGVNHHSEFDKENERDTSGASVWLHVMDIHSHGSSMSAFWSGTDDADEKKAPEGRMFGVIGKVSLPMPEWRWRMRTREGFIDLKVTDVFNIEREQEVPFTVPWGVILDATGEKDAISTDGLVRLLCPVDPFKDATCPPEWHTQVKGWNLGDRSGGFGRIRDRITPLPMYLYIARDGLLEEFLVDAESQEPPKPTGKKVIWKRNEGMSIDPIPRQ